MDNQSSHYLTLSLHSFLLCFLLEAFVIPERLFGQRSSWTFKLLTLLHQVDSECAQPCITMVSLVILSAKVLSVEKTYFLTVLMIIHHFIQLKPSMISNTISKRFWFLPSH